MSAKKNSKNNLKNRIQTRSDVHKQLISSEDENTSTEKEEEVHVNKNVNVYKKRKNKFEDRYVRQTFYIEKYLLSKLNQVSEEKGDKTRIINEALQKHLEE